MGHRARAAQSLTKGGQHQPAMPAPLYHGPSPGVAGGADQMSVVQCQCSTFLDPYPSGQSAQWR